MREITEENYHIDMNEEMYRYYKTDFQNGYITIGNLCSAACVFCSQQWNQPGLIANLKRFLSIEELKHFAGTYLDEIRCIGSGLRTNTGEFFFCRDSVKMLEVLDELNKLKQDTIIFSNGMDMTEEHVRVIKRYNLHLFLSLNSSDLNHRKRIMGGHERLHRNAMKVMEWLDEYDVNYEVFVVPMRSSLESGDIEETVRFLKNTGANSLGFHRPGFTRYSTPEVAAQLNVTNDEIVRFGYDMTEKYDFPVGEGFRQLEPVEKGRYAGKEVGNLMTRHPHLREKRKLFLSAASVADVMPGVIKEIPNSQLRVVPNSLYGGNVDCSGLLLVEDYIGAIEANIAETGITPEAVIIPRTSFDKQMMDLKFVPAETIRRHFTGMEMYLVCEDPALSKTEYPVVEPVNT